MSISGQHPNLPFSLPARVKIHPTVSLLRWVHTKGVQDLAMSTDFNAHLITSRQPSEECKSKVLLNLEDVFPNYEANLTPDLFRL